MEGFPLHARTTSFTVLSHFGGYVVKSADHIDEPNFDSDEFHLDLSFKFNLRRRQTLENSLHAWKEQQELQLRKDLDLLWDESEEDEIKDVRLPLRLPPRLEIASDPKARDSVKRSSKRKEIDPFLKAIEKVRKEKGESRWRPKALRRRASALLSMRLVSNLHGCSSGWSHNEWEEGEGRKF